MGTGIYNNHTMLPVHNELLVELFLTLRYGTRNLKPAYCIYSIMYRMPKKTKQYGWQCSECDKDPSEPFQTPKEVIDLTAPR
jgi:hypothetical protein